MTIPAVKQYTPAQYAQMAKEHDAFCLTGLAAMLCQAFTDYGVMRDQARAALGLDVDVTR